MGLRARWVRAAPVQVRRRQKEQERALRCKDIYPFVASCWRIDVLDLSDAARWISDASLGALRSLPSLQSVRLTSCRFVGDAGMSFAPSLPQLHTLDVSWTAVTDAGLTESVSRCGASLTSLNLTGLSAVTDRGTSALLGLGRLERLSLGGKKSSNKTLETRAAPNIGGGGASCGGSGGGSSMQGFGSSGGLSSGGMASRPRSSSGGSRASAAAAGTA